MTAVVVVVAAIPVGILLAVFARLFLAEANDREELIYSLSVLSI